LVEQDSAVVASLGRANSLGSAVAAAESGTESLTVSAFLKAHQHADLFDIAPTSLALLDYSGVKTRFTEWRRQGICDLREWLKADASRARECARSVRLLAANKRALAIWGAADFNEISAIFARAFDGRQPLFTEGLIHFWNGQTLMSGKSAVYANSGARVDLCVEAQILPQYENWSRVLFAFSDISAEEEARRQQALSEAHARGVFEQAPVSLWVEDFSSLKIIFETCRSEGVADLRQHIQAHPEFIEKCLAAVRVIDINQQTLNLFGASDKSTLLGRLDHILGGQVQPYFMEELIQLWEGKLQQRHEVENYTLHGNLLYLLLHLSIMPGNEHDWSRVLIALTDITARKKAEAGLAYLGRHDVLTKVYNRSFYAEEIERLETGGPFPVSIIVTDLNGLKPVNDELGHAAGDDLLRRAGEVLLQAVANRGSVARIGGDEFVVLLPATREVEAEQIIADIKQTTERNNQGDPAAPSLSFSIGHATGQAGDRLASVTQNADLLMYQAKRDHYAAHAAANRRRG
jgi:diguanylate cyclase (GGDEF)-like protein